MRLFLLAVLAGVLAGCSKGDDLKTAALRVEIHYEGFRPGCVTLTVTDQADASRYATTNVNVPTGSAPGTLSVAVFRQAGWSHGVKLLAAAKEQDCDGAQVVTDETTASLARNGITPVSLDLSATDWDGDGFVAQDEGGTDCNDRDETQGGPTIWYPDDDGDNHGSSLLPPVKACEAPSLNYASNADDCDDNDPSVHPGVAELRCDGRDDNCNGKVDEGFDVGAGCTTALGCRGVTACSNGNGVCNETEAPIPYYMDVDGDGKAGVEVDRTCGTIPPNTSTELADCDESSRFRAQGFPEVCDRIDNDCSDVADDGLSCNTTWQPSSGGDTTSWKAIATDGAGRIWLAGDSGKLALRDANGSKLITCDGDWKAAWVASSGEVFLAGSKGGAGRFARAAPNATTCMIEATSQGLNGLVGIESPSGGMPTLYGVTGGGQTFQWTPPASPTRIQTATVNGAALRAISGVGSPDTLLAVGSKDTNTTPTAFRFNAADSTWIEEVLPTLVLGELRGVHVVNASYAYAVGDLGMVFERINGKWSEMKAVPAAFAGRSLQDVLAFGRTAVYVVTTDGPTTGGAVLFFDGSDWITDYTDASSPARALRSLDGKAPSGIVIAGDRGAAATFTASPR